ncbi:hypothetical protein [Methylobacterium nodulans]|uniref:Putative signal peptide n=1 Tax=Methylobacterium nodulans (strain LMG 21967 / CNCM I-2342 / ORS 2060) TaxID=460265 RepID=B8IW78_METNO|nr:putative signal peptide [Methylobacterium nodulans ORS 2060]
MPLTARAAVIVLSLGSLTPARAQEVEVDAEPNRLNREQPVTVADPTPPLPERSDSIGKWTFGGTFRLRYDARFDDARPGGDRRTSSHLSWDTLGLKLAYDSDTVFGAAQYRFYGASFLYSRRSGYEGYPGEVNFPMYAYVGYKLSPFDSITFGLNQVPFGLVPYFSTTWLETLGFAMGIEEVYNFGVKYSHVEPEYNYQLGFYPGANPNAFGISRDSARYSTNIVRADSYVPFGSDNAEQNMIVGRAEYFFIKNDFASLAAGVSIWHSDIYNFTTRQTGTKQLEAIHVNATRGQWGFKSIFARQDINPKNPIRNDLITIGGYDGSYNMATHGNFIAAEVSYKLQDDVGPFNLVPYFSYSRYIKDQKNFRDSQRFVVGGAWTLKADPGLIIYTELVTGKNDPYVGAGQYVSGLAQGGDNKWKSSIYINIGYYF